LLHQANDFLGPILIYGFGVIMAGTPLTILVLAVINFIRAASRRGTIVLQALISIILWVILTFVLVMILMVIIFSFPYPLSQADELKSTGVFILGSLLYLAVGFGLIFWTKRQAALSAVAQSA
jgi:hypothetical protein